jgi:hypothetical protein
MITRALPLLWLLAAPLAQAAQNHLLIVGGIGGIEAYSEQFASGALRLYQSALTAGIAPHNIVVLSATPLPQAAPPRRNADKATLLQALREIGVRAQADDRVFVVLLGHGNPRGDGAMFNLSGPDISAAELAAALDGLATQLVVIVNTASASGPFVKALSADRRVVISATSSGREYHATLFGEFFVNAFATPGADTDKDERISMLEAFNFARREVQRAFDSDKRLPTEHALLDDNGDGEGSLEPGEFEPDGALANRVYLQQPPTQALGASAQLVEMTQRKQALEQSIGELKRQRESLPRGDYYDRLEGLLVELALLSREIRAEAR